MRRLILLAAVLLSVLGAPLRAAGIYDDNVVVVLDASGSMREPMHSSGMPKMAAAKAALIEVLKQVPTNTNIGLLVFSGSGVTNEWVYPLGPRDDARLTRAVNQPQPNGGTPLGAYIKKGADRLLAEREKRVRWA